MVLLAPQLATKTTRAPPTKRAALLLLNNYFRTEISRLTK